MLLERMKRVRRMSITDEFRSSRRGSGLPPAVDDADQKRQVTRAARQMRLSNIWSRYGATMVCTAGGGILGHAFCLLQLAVAVYGGFSVTHPAFYAAPTALVYGLKRIFDRVKPPKDSNEQRQRRNFLVVTAAASVVGIGWNMHYHLGKAPDGSYGKDFKDLTPAQQEYLKGEIGLYYFPQLSPLDHQKTLRDAKAADKDPVAYVFDRNSVGVMQACQANREKQERQEPKALQRLARPLLLN